ncbi:MAG: Hsp70 family protein [Planctomycetota bacterium]|jgi:molecular chaperone DnaK (HSP70)
MPLLPEPIFYQTIKREDGAKRKLIYIINSDEEDVSLEVTDVEKPEWVEIEEIFPGAKIDLKSGKRTPVIVNLNTNHRFFPHGSSMEEKVHVQFGEDLQMDIPVTIQAITEGIEDFQGVFAIDFGTTNTCYSYKGKLDEYQDAYSAEQTQSSPEIPSLIFFKDVSSSTNPKYMVGNSAKQEITEFGWQTYSYFQSIKRDLGTDRSVVVMDRHAAEGEGHRQEWHVEEVSSFIIREIINRAQKDIGQRIMKVVATFPTLYTLEKKEALTRAFERAFQDLGVEFTNDTVTLDLDETNAAAFNYIYGTMLDEMRGLSVREKSATLLSYDFGGGTVDVSLIGITISRDDVGRINIVTDVKGLTGERYYGGDNVTLEVARLLKKKAALIVAERIQKDVVAKAEADAKAKDAEDDFFGGGFGGGKPKEEEDIFASADDEEATEEVKEVAEEDPELSEIVNRDTESEYNTSVELVSKHKEVIEGSIAKGLDLTQAFLAWEEEQGTLVAKDQSERKAEQLERAVERLIPTKYAEYENVDPHKAEVARRLFGELWQEADVLKIRLSQSQLGTERVANIFKRIAKYANIDSIAFSELEVSLAELESAAEPRIRESISKAHKLYKSTMRHAVDGLAGGGSAGGSGLEIVGEASSGLVIDDGKHKDDEDFRILLAGNGARLPMIRRMVKEIFSLDDSRIIMESKSMKTGVARGAAEEFYLRSAFGKSGIITYNPSGFLEKIPYAIELYQRDLEFMGFENGICPVFPRGTRINSKTVLSGRNNPLIHEDMKQLTLFADYHDGSPPYYLGRFDLTKPREGEGAETAPPPPEEPAPETETPPAEGDSFRAGSPRLGTPKPARDSLSFRGRTSGNRKRILSRAPTKGVNEST